MTAFALALLGSAVLACASPSSRAEAPQAMRANGVTTERLDYLGRAALKVELTAERQAAILDNRAAANGPTYAVVAEDFGDGIIELDVAATVNGKGARDSRGFVGVAFRTAPGEERFEAIYLRATNGRLAEPKPPAPRDARAIQYIAHPDFHFDRSRRVAPGRYEAGANIGPGRWSRLRLELEGDAVRALIDGEPALQVTGARLAGSRGGVALWVDDGSTGYFSNLRITPR
jgi:hypothetical protein